MELFRFVCWSVSPVDEVYRHFQSFVDFSNPRYLKRSENQGPAATCWPPMRLAHDGALELEQALLRHVAFEVELQQQIQVS